MQKIMTEKERMLSEKLYIPMDEALAADCARSRRLVRLINGTTEEQAEYRVRPSGIMCSLPPGCASIPQVIPSTPEYAAGSWSTERR